LRVEVKAPARLHLGFITPVPMEGRSFGSLGIAVEEPASLVQAEPAEGLLVEGLRAEDAERFASATLSWLGIRGAKVRVAESPLYTQGLALRRSWRCRLRWPLPRHTALTWIQ